MTCLNCNHDEACHGISHEQDNACRILREGKKCKCPGYSANEEN